MSIDLPVLGCSVKKYKKATDPSTSVVSAGDIKMSALLFICGINSKLPFQLATDVHGAGIFKNIVLKYKYSPTQTPWNTCFIRTDKDGELKIDAKTFSSGQGHIYLNKYVESIKTIETIIKSNKKSIVFDGPFENCTFVILTNNKIDAAVETVFEKETREENVAILMSAIKDGAVFGIRENSCNEHFAGLEETCSEAKEMLQNFRIFLAGLNESRMDDLIKKELSKAWRKTYCDLDTIFRAYMKAFEECGAKNVVLNQDDDIVDRGFSEARGGCILLREEMVYNQ